MKPLRIGLISSLYTALPPKKYGGIERVIYAVSEALHARGHEVTIFGSDKIESSCRSIAYGTVSGEENMKRRSGKFRLWNLLYGRRREFDVIHNFFHTASLLSILPLRLPKVMSYACPLNLRTIRMADMIGGRSIHYTVCGRHMLNQLGPGMDRSRWHVVYNPIDVSPYKLSNTSRREDPYLVFLSRLTHEKGASIAIEVARRAGKRLVLAGNVLRWDEEYFAKEIQPFLDGKQIEYIGAIDDQQKNALLGGAEAMLFPIMWDEPFGLVVGEAMACGAPVLAFNRGAMPEIIEDGKTGILCDNVEQMVAAVGKIDTIDRAACRASVESRFSPDHIASEYEKVYAAMLA